VFKAPGVSGIINAVKSVVKVGDGNDWGSLGVYEANLMLENRL